MAAATDGETAVIDEVVADKGYHSNQVLVDLAALDLRTYIAEPARGRRKWKRMAAARTAVYANRRRIRGTPRAGLAAAPQRAGWSARVRISTRPVGCGGGFNLRLLMRTLIGVGTPLGLQGRLAALRALFSALWTHVSEL